MYFPKYWAKGSHEFSDHRGRHRRIACWRWSDESRADAERAAVEAARAAAAKLARGEPLDKSYLYGDRPLREEVVEEISPPGEGGDTSAPRAVITRNTYGCLVLNTSRTMILDIDFEEVGLLDLLRNLFRKMFGNKVRSGEEVALASLAGWVRDHPTWKIRVYRTFAGLRCIVLHEIFDPSTETARELLERLGCDPLYIKLCKNQESYRARLSPKPWRIGVDLPPSRYPWGSAEEEARYRAWEELYARKARGSATCRLVGVLGKSEVATDPEIARLVDLHDAHTLSGEELPLG